MEVGDQPHDTTSIMPSAMRALVLYASLTGNTKKVAGAIAEELSCRAVNVRREELPELTGVELLLVGDGVYGGKPSRAMVRALRSLPELSGVKAAVFGTYGAKPGQLPVLSALLEGKGAQVIGKFACPGRDWFTLGLLRWGRPNREDLERAQAFAREMARKAGYSPGERSR